MNVPQLNSGAACRDVFHQRRQWLQFASRSVSFCHRQETMLPSIFVDCTLFLRKCCSCRKAYCTFLSFHVRIISLSCLGLFLSFTTHVWFTFRPVWKTDRSWVQILSVEKSSPGSCRHPSSILPYCRTRMCLMFPRRPRFFGLFKVVTLLRLQHIFQH